MSHGHIGEVLSPSCRRYRRRNPKDRERGQGCIDAETKRDCCEETGCAETQPVDRREARTRAHEQAKPPMPEVSAAMRHLQRALDSNALTVAPTSCRISYTSDTPSCRSARHNSSCRPSAGPRILCSLIGPALSTPDCVAKLWLRRITDRDSVRWRRAFAGAMHVGAAEPFLVGGPAENHSSKRSVPRF
jgi:hypothetical protein